MEVRGIGAGGRGIESDGAGYDGAGYVCARATHMSSEQSCVMMGK